MNTRVLSVLMWKHAMVRKRRFIQTAVEFASPIMFFLLLFAFKNHITRKPSADHRDPVANTEVIPITDFPVPHWILYYPDTPLTETLMNEVGLKLNLKKLDNFPDYTVRGYFPCTNESLIAEFASKMRLREAIVIFEKMSDETWPDRLNYTIRMKDHFGIDSYESLDDTPGPHKMFGRKYETFMRIQWAIDMSYIKLLTSTEVPQALSVQEFPYYRVENNESISIICLLLMTVCWISMMLPFVFLMGRLLHERATGIQELIKMVGVSQNLLGISHFLNVLLSGLVFSIGGAILLKSTSNPLINNSNGFLIFLMLLLYFNTVMSMAFACSYISKGTQYVATLSVLAYVVLWIPARVKSDYDLPYMLTLASGLLPHVPMHWFWKEVAVLEMYGSGVYFSNMLSAKANYNGSVFLSFVFMLLQAAIFYCLTWYLSLVRPGQYGQALPWNFLCKTQYWSKNEVIPDTESEEENPMAQDPKFFEPPPANAEVGIKIVNVSKVYPKQRVLRNINLEVYKGEITVLLGHNGAGKTTLMSIITGMTSATEGNVYVNGKDTVRQRDEVRQNLGLCPQHNLFFPDLSLREHIMFFTLRGTYAEARSSSRALAARLGLEDKLGAACQLLSGGMKRRAQLACALAGGADVLILDEPTSGLDVETRRELWDLLLSLRGQRTVLLTTHFMEEADALGDRVAALHAGVLRCHATPMHLKRAVGTGYRLSFTTIGTPKEDAITNVVTSHVPDATLKEKTINSLSYNLPAASAKKFPTLFAALEAKRSELGIDSIGVGVSTLEEVFLKLCSDVDNTMSEDEVDGNSGPDISQERLTGVPLYLRQIKVLLIRQVKYAIYKKWSFLALQLVFPMITIIAMTHFTNNAELQRNPDGALRMSLDLYGDRPDHRVLLSLRSNDFDTKAFTEHFPRLKFEDTNDVADAVLRTGEKDVLEYNKYIVGVEMNDTDAKILYTTTVRHAAPVALNVLSNVLAARGLPWADGRTISTVNRPVPPDAAAPTKQGMPKNLITLVTWGMCVTFIILATNVNSVSLACKERESGARHLHVMSGCPAELHWAATLAAHAALAALSLVLPVCLAALLLDQDRTIDQPDLLGLLTPFMAVAQKMFSNSPSGLMHMALVTCGYLMPPHTLVTAVLQALNVGQINAMCHWMRSKQVCPGAYANENGLDVEKCCAGENPRCYFCIDDFSPGQNMIVLFLQFTVLMAMVFLTERGFFNGLVNKLANLRYQPTSDPQADEMVRAEKAYVSRAIKLPSKQIPDAMLVDDIHKNYVSILKKSVNAVKGVSFSVKKGECFGLLGVNGAGKSSTFKMLTAEESATRGEIFGNGYRLTRGNPHYLQTLGYCPQFFGLDMFQTGRDNLRLVLTLRGYDDKHVKEEVDNWIHIVGLEKYANRAVEEYSGGCVRRLGAASALCGGAALCLLDEPSAGVDVAARRRLWAALRTALRRGRSVIITSHSMDEMEALCSRIAILSAGRVRALGTAAALRAAHAHGHAVVFKTMLHYHINDTMRYSELFTELEALKAEFPNLIEDYSVTETTLEEVFLSFAKEQQAINESV
ncbi:hypothetical protein HW555_001946 [Spodoptera exigua]|uniref:ABC transporter domain-containing protein n=1 Tax=Spodoptera exigua TaxID=7107 RepID=A0A835GP32_SPOEX|nr:hypothetical protein HW555_001946 [Spodoptera exigua]